MSSVTGATIRYFVTMCQNVLPDTAYVFFGQALTVFSAPITLQVTGWSGEQVPAQLSPQARREETFTIESDLVSQAGDFDFLTREDEVMANWALITSAVGNDFTLGGNVRWAQVGRYTFTAAADKSKGMSLGALSFGIECQVRIDSLV
jgi:hypothetical protein